MTPNWSRRRPKSSRLSLQNPAMHSRMFARMLTAIRRGTAAARVVQAGAGSAYASQGTSAIADEAFVIRAHELRAEVARLLAASGYAVR